MKKHSDVCQYLAMFLGGFLNFWFKFYPISKNGDCFDRYLLRLRELDESNNILYQVINQIPSGSIQYINYVMQPPLKTKIKITIQSLIYHFCFFSNKINLRLGEIYLSIEAPKGEFGIFLV